MTELRRVPTAAEPRVALSKSVIDELRYRVPVNGGSDAIVGEVQLKPVPGLGRERNGSTDESCSCRQQLPSARVTDFQPIAVRGSPF